MARDKPNMVMIMQRSPLVILGTGGSGTRVFARLAAVAGRHMGAHRNEAEDAMALFWLANRWCGELYEGWRDGERMDLAGFEAELRPCVEAHLIERLPGEAWGWKQPRSIYLLPALIAAYPDLLVLHVVRDGRDIAFGAQARLAVAGAYAAPLTSTDEPRELRLARMWDEPNRMAADLGEDRLGERYLRLRLEDACARPVETAAQLASFVEGETISPEEVASIVRTPATLGRWRDAEERVLQSVARAASQGLERFGYLTA